MEILKSFLLKNNKPILKWGQIPDGYFFEGNIPEGYSLAVSPSSPYVILDVDVKNVNGFKIIPKEILTELNNTFNYATKSGGRHYWIKYTGDKPLFNRATKYGIDLRTNKGYVRWYPKEDIRDCIFLIKDSTPILNEFLEKFFS